MEDLNDLFAGPVPGPWADRLTGEQKAWLEFVADSIRENGRDPALTWREIHRRFATRWPGDEPARAETLTAEVRRMVRESA